MHNTIFGIGMVEDLQAWSKSTNLTVLGIVDASGFEHAVTIQDLFKANQLSLRFVMKQSIQVWVCSLLVGLGNDVAMGTIELELELRPFGLHLVHEIPIFDQPQLILAPEQQPMQSLGQFRHISLDTLHLLIRTALDDTGCGQKVGEEQLARGQIMKLIEASETAVADQLAVVEQHEDLPRLDVLQGEETLPHRGCRPCVELVLGWLHNKLYGQISYYLCYQDRVSRSAKAPENKIQTKQEM